MPDHSLSQRLSVNVDALKPESMRNASQTLGLGYVELHNLANIKDFPALSEMLSSFNLKPLQVHGPSSPDFDIGNLDPVARTKIIESHKSILQRCSEIGTKYYVIHPGGLMYGRWDDARQIGIFDFDRGFAERLLDQNVSSITELCDAAGQVGMKIALENGQFDIPAFLDLGDYSTILERADNRNLGVCIDTGHANMGMVVKPSEIIRRFGPMICALHLNDNLGLGDMHLPPGMGNIDWKSVVSAIKEINYQGAFNLEVSPKHLEGKDFWKELGDALGLLRQLIIAE